MSKFSIGICLAFGVVSILQTLNAKLLFKILKFNFFSFIFIIERIINIVIILSLRTQPINYKHLRLTIPYSILMCTTNILTSLCITVMPLESFVSFKKFLILFVILFSLLGACLLKKRNVHGVLKIGVELPAYRIVSVGLIVVGGIMIGMYTNSHPTVGYMYSMLSNIFEALSLQYCSYLYLKYSVSPSDLLLYNSVLSLPYYLGFIIYYSQVGDVIEYFNATLSPYFGMSFALMIMLGSLSELTANLITMKISPFEKATVSNIKDLIILIISVKVFHEMEIMGMNELGIILCLIGSAMFSLPALIYQKIKSEKGILINELTESNRQSYLPAVKAKGKMINNTLGLSIDPLSIRFEEHEVVSNEQPKQTSQFEQNSEPETALLQQKPNSPPF